MNNKDRENLICFLAKFQGGGEPTKDILSRYPESDLISDVWMPLEKLSAEIEGYAKGIAVSIFTGMKGRPDADRENLYPHREDQKVFRIGVYDGKENRYDWLHEVRSSCQIELTDKGIDRILESLASLESGSFCYCEWIDGLDHPENEDHYFLRRYSNDKDGRIQLRMMVLCFLAKLESDEV